MVQARKELVGKFVVTMKEKFKRIDERFDEMNGIVARMPKASEQ